MRAFPEKSVTGLMMVMLLMFAGIATPALSAITVDVVQDDGQKEQVELYSTSFALVVGIDQYSGGGWPRLSNAVRDAKAVAAALEDRGFDVTLKFNTNRRDLIAAMEDFFYDKGSDPDARLLFWFAGHGDTQNGEGFIIPVDGVVQEQGAKFLRTAISVRRVSTLVRLTQSKHVMTIFDSCFSGTVFDTPRAKPPAVISNASLSPVRQFLTSGEARQQVSDDGMFQELFLAALNGEEDADLNNDGFITGTEIGMFMTDRVTNLTDSRQTPRSGKLRDRDFDRGDFIFSSARLRRPVPAEPDARQQANTPDESRYVPEQDTAFWNSIQGSDDWREYQAYIDQFGEQGTYTTVAKLRVEKLRPADAPAPDVQEPEPDIAEPVVPEIKRDSEADAEFDDLVQKAEAGDGDAQFEIATAYYYGLRGRNLNYPAAMSWYQKAVEQGRTEAMTTIGYMHEKGLGVDVDYAEALRWYRKAADLKETIAQYNIGVFYETGLGVEADDAEALRWYRMAAEKGDSAAQNNIGVFYENGRGVEVDYGEALRWYNMAADQNYSWAQNNIGLIYENGRGVEVDKTEALRWYLKAADQGYAQAQYNVGVFFETGAGVDVDEAEALRWYRMAAEQGMADAQTNVGYMTHYGEGTAVDYAEALRWYHLAAEQGDQWAQNNIGWMHLKGEGIPVNYDEAARWFRLAASQGNDTAISNLNFMQTEGLL